LGIITPTDELIFFRGIETTNQIFLGKMVVCHEFFMGYSMRFIMGFSETYDPQVTGRLVADPFQVGI